MSKRTIHILTFLFIIIIAAEGFFILKTFSSDTDSNAGKNSIAGTVSVRNDLTVTDSDTGAAVTGYSINLNGTPAEGVFVAAEDLVKQNTRFETANNGTVLNYDKEKPVGPVPENVRFTEIPNGSPVYKESFSLSGKEIAAYSTYGVHLVSVDDLKKRFECGLSSVIQPNEAQTAAADAGTTSGSAGSIQGEKAELQTKKDIPNKDTPSSASKGIIVLDPGHGKSSSSMTAEEKEAAGFVKTSKGWGEWRHWKTGTSGTSCEGSGCSGRHPANGGCWYPIGNGDRDKEPQINLANALSAKAKLEQLGYTVRMTRTTNNENLSFTKRLSFCYPNNNNALEPDADLCVVIHSNAGGGRGSAYISAGGTYDQKMKDGVSTVYAQRCNEAGKAINSRIVNQTSLSACGSGVINGLESLIAFCKSPVPLAYLEIGFFDSASDLSILNSESDKIGQAIAEGIDDYMKSATN